MSKPIVVSDEVAIELDKIKNGRSYNEVVKSLLMPHKELKDKLEIIEKKVKMLEAEMGQRSGF